jgi:hypothetical protein
MSSDSQIRPGLWTSGSLNCRALIVSATSAAIAYVLTFFKGADGVAAVLIVVGIVLAYLATSDVIHRERLRRTPRDAWHPFRLFRNPLSPWSLAVACGALLLAVGHIIFEWSLGTDTAPPSDAAAARVAALFQVALSTFLARRLVFDDWLQQRFSELNAQRTTPTAYEARRRALRDPP